MAGLQERIEEGLQSEGYGTVYTHTDAPMKIYEDHVHDVETAHIVVKGLIEITMDGMTHVLQKGDRCDVPAGMVHSAKVGEKGCTYVIGER